MSSPCAFCTLPAERVWIQKSGCVAFFDGFPISEGHTLVIPSRHVASLFELTDGEQETIWKFVTEIREALRVKYNPDGFNVGLNDGFAAGQTIGHAHIHIIPRRKGDLPDPRGGVRWIIPEKAKYWNS